MRVCMCVGGVRAHVKWWNCYMCGGQSTSNFSPFHLPSETGSNCSLPYINRQADPQASEGSSVSTAQPALGCGIINGATTSYFIHAQGIQA